jgi:hypothetical protein
MVTQPDGMPPEVAMSRLYCLLFASVISIGPAQALDVDFNGTVTGVCSLALDTDGTLALSADGTILGSEETLGVPAAVLVLSIGSNTIDVAAPARISADPSGYDDTNETVEVSYGGLGGLAGVTQAYTEIATDFGVGNIALSVLLVNNRIVNPDGFAAGTYTTRTVVTCS